MISHVYIKDLSKHVGESVTLGDHEIGVKGDYAFWGAAVAGIAWATDEGDLPTTGSA